MSTEQPNTARPDVPLISVVVPAHDEAGSVPVFHARTAAVLEKMGVTFEIIYVNDGSRDGTLDEMLSLARTDPRVRAIDLSRNFGKEIAMTAGIDAACGRAVIPIDIDLQDPPELIPDLVAKWREGYDVVYATRQERGGEPLLRRATAGLFYRLMEKITAITIPRDTGDFRLMSRPVVDALHEIPERHRFMKGLFSWVGFRQVGITYRREPRCAGKTKWNYWKLWNFAIEGITSFSHVPLQAVTWFGFLVSVGAFLYALFIILHTLFTGGDVPGYPSLITVILFIGGVQLIALGILGEYIGRIHDEVKSRPLYIVRAKHGFGSNDE